MPRAFLLPPHLRSRRPQSRALLAAFAAAALLRAHAACGNRSTEEPAPAVNRETRSLTLGAYSTPREAYQAILPAFCADWRQQHGETLEVKQSYLGSGAQARAIAGGFEADVAALSLEPDLEALRGAKLITRDWSADPHAGIVTRSLVVIGVRKGNPKRIHDFDDLARDGIELLTPDARTSGGAMWNIAAIYGAALRGHAGAAAGDKHAAGRLLARVLRNVKVFDRGARESLLNFERGLGDAILTYENEILVGRAKGQDYEYVVPASTILIENPVAVVDAYAQRHGSEHLARALVAYLHGPAAQRAFAQNGLRPVDDAVAAETSARFAKPNDLFTIRDLGGWPAVEQTLFAPGAAYDHAVALAAEGRTR